jgi:outer membrane autotransporter protein
MVAGTPDAALRDLLMTLFSAPPCFRSKAAVSLGCSFAAAVMSAAPAAASDALSSHLLFANVPLAYAQLAPAGGSLRARVEAVPGVALGDPGLAAAAEPAVGVEGAAITSQQTRASISGFGFSSRVGSDANGAGFRTRGGGGTLTIDRFLTPTFLGGVALGYSRSETTSPGVRSEADTVSGAVYGAWLPYLGWEIEGLLGVDGSEIDSRRVLFSGTTPVPTRGDTTSIGFSAIGNVGYRFRFPTTAGAAFLKPFAGLAYSTQERDDYTEFGATGPGLVFPSNTFERATFNLGAAAGIDLAAGSGWIVRPELRVAWSHYLTDPVEDVPAFLGGTPIVLRDPNPGRDGAVVGLEVTALNAGLQLFAGYAGEFRDNSTAHQGRVGLRVSW